MKQEICPKIRENYPLYKTLVEKHKKLEAQQIVLGEKPNNKKWRTKEELLNHDSREEVIFNAEKQTYGFKYGLRLFVKELHDQPVFYFDSDGPSHDNSDGKTKLLETRIKTPHINFYDEMGVKKARRNQFIEENEVVLQSDINIGMHLFCEEANINKGGKIPDISSDLHLLPLTQKTEHDVHEGVDFLNEN
ncbi:hypothetical protein BN8_02852 [Fibrisoma limi BUZ 3]|uniref:Uncharacterized protein n=1 Tax=Fibrisoma limi BUZ 3 TaxID=1185876 RepID=I2GIK9_9BACT|nr:hypothetical protein [Fibrisoma limi]CCH53734.1 hypothetical protein BN8_02852 [Fibrisoma limi BUZ 3]